MKKTKSFIGKFGRFLLRNLQTICLLIGLTLISIGMFMINEILGIIGVGVFFLITAIYINYQWGGDDY